MKTLRSIWRLSTTAGVLAAAGMMAALSGCGGGGDEGPERFGVSGTVQYEGQPVPSGTVVFEPDASKGNSGPQGYAQIHDGEYDTSADGGKGVVGGPHIVRINAPGFKYTSPEPVELPKESSEQPFDLKKDQVQVIPENAQEV